MTVHDPRPDAVEAATGWRRLNRTFHTQDARATPLRAPGFVLLSVVSGLCAIAATELRG